MNEPPRRLLYTHSCSSAFRACPRKYAIAYVRKTRAARPAWPLLFGTAAHEGVAAYFLARQRGEKDRRGASLAALPDLGDPFEQAKLRVMMVTHAVVWDAMECEVLAVEKAFVAPFLHPETRAPHPTFDRAGKIDAVIRLGDGRLALIETKTSSAEVGPGSDYRRRLSVDEQISQYIVGGASLGFRTDLVVYNILRKFGERPLKATPPEKRLYVVDKQTKQRRLRSGHRDHDETPEEYAERIAKVAAKDPEAMVVRTQVVRLAHERKRFATEAWVWADWMARAHARGEFPPNYAACDRYGSTCEFAPHCLDGLPLDDPKHFRTLDVTHPELDEVDPPGGEHP